MKLKGVLIAALLLAPGAALAAPGIVTASVGLRAGPGPGFPMVDRIPAGARVNIHGCLRGNAWCDVSWTDDRGWVSSQYLEYLYRNRYVYLPDYVDEIDVPVAPFVLSSYWSSYYSGRPWYHRRAYWNDYWSSHQSTAMRPTIDPRAARIGRAAAARDATIAVRGDTAKRDAAPVAGRTRAGVSERVTREQTIDRARDAREARGRALDARARMTRENGPARAAARVQQQPIAHARPQPPAMARGHEAPRVSAAPAARPATPHVAQPSVSHGPPMNARAQMPAPRAAAPAMPHAGGGGAPHVNAAPRGGPAAGGPPGHQKH
ncbi:SH3 domain-containing protein [Bradyrhizobium manausense]|uniref:SH3 domain-containing protein n=1 Tax=Bradyrhizobium TaxID=374 RepID=UPI001BA87F55|nr:MULTISPECIES: SH3 domain-containing protein [Bradyrhizobium]MBR0828132.1 SH3 domain-containing protein [Bradyrhizobium manausense]UVO32987.1 SH3 domain-containing protein [Bradyrhizobium arachidis]